MRRFFSFVEIRTKIASILPFLLGTAYAATLGYRLDAVDAALFFCSMLLFDMTTTAVNNAMDAHRHGGPTPRHYTWTRTRVLIGLMGGSAACGGILLAVRNGPVVWICGILFFAAGLLYTAGPLPLSRLPLGEVFSGLLMGMGIPFLAVFIHAPANSWVSLIWQNGVLYADIHILALVRLGILCTPAAAGIAGIMLANNICDLEADRAIGRLTLPHFLGHRRSLILLAALYGAAFLAVAAMVIWAVLPVWVLAAGVAALPVARNTAVFWRQPDKQKTFPLSVANLLWLVLPLVAVAVLAAWTGWRL